MKITTYTTCDEIMTDDGEWVGLVDRGTDTAHYLKWQPAKLPWKYRYVSTQRTRAITQEELVEAGRLGAERVKLRNLTDRMLK